MYKKVAFLFLLLFSLYLLNAQNHTPIPTGKNLTVTGKIIDKETRLALEYATVSIFNTTNNKIVDGNITDINGKFSIKIPEGTYNIKIEYISYKTIDINNKHISSNLDLGDIALEINSQALDAVEIIAEKTTVELKLDKRVYTVGKDLTVSGGTVSDVLNNVPSVSINQDGNVALRGSENVRILINGKPSGLVGMSPTQALQQLPAESIERVEVITAPSARYDAEGTAGIINIILRRSKMQGFNGSLTSNLGYPYAAGVSANVNYRIKDVNIFNTSSYNYRDQVGRWFNDVDYFDPNTPDLDEQRRWTDTHKGLTTNTGVEWYITDKASITNSFLYRDNNTDTESVNTIKKTYEVTNNEDTILRASPRLSNNNTIQYALNFTDNINTNGHKLSADFQYEKTNDSQDTFVSIDNIDAEKAYRDEDQTKILAQTDYVLPVGKDSQFEVGYRGTFDKTITDFNVFTFDTNSGTFVLDNNFSSEFNFQQDINAFYTQFGSKIDKVSYLLGLRYEGTKTIIEQPKTGIFDKELLEGLFPTLNLNYEINENQSLSLGYNRRITRPRGFMLNPFPSRSSTTDVFQGNPGLNPTFTGSSELSYLNKFGKFTFSSAMYYSNSKQVISFASFRTGNYVNIRTGLGVDINDPTVPNEDKAAVLERSPVNINKENRYGLEFNLNYNPIKKWRLNSNFNIYKFERFGNYQGIDLSANNVSWTGRLSNKITLPYSIDWQTNLNYTGPNQDAQNKNKGRLITDIAFSKDLFKSKASLSFSVNDIFNSAYQSITNTSTFTSFREIQFRRGPIYNLAFTYRFNQTKKRERENNTNSSPNIEM